jgi:hypothetical protein
MKKNTLSPEWQKIFLSVLILGLVILAAVGSFQLDLLGLNMRVDRVYTGNGSYTETEEHQNENAIKTTTGKLDKQGRWHGSVSIHWEGNEEYLENATFEHGMRQGLSVRVYPPDGKQVESHYFNGVQYELKKAAGAGINPTAYQLLYQHYPWFPFSLNAWGFSDALIEACMDTIEVLMGANEFDPAQFDDFYGDATDALAGTRFDSLIAFNSELSLYKGIENLKSEELRLALVESYGTGETLYERLEGTHPGYLAMLGDSGITAQDAEQFCAELEDSLASYGTLDRDDPFFADSIDSWLYRGLMGMIDMSLKSTLAHGFNPQKMKEAFHQLKNDRITGSSDVVALVVVSLMLPRILEGDMMRKSLLEAYVLRKGIVVLPLMSTALVEKTSSTSVDIRGCIVDNGGGTILTCGIAWGTTYNPTWADNIVTTDVFAGLFTLNITGLETGKTYYVRSYAVNDLGTGYGNCISFVAGNASTNPENKNNVHLYIYQEKATSSLVFNLTLPGQQQVSLAIYNMNGQLVLKHEAGILVPGENEMRLSSAGLAKGVYTCRVRHGSETAVQKFTIY